LQGLASEQCNRSDERLAAARHATPSPASAHTRGSAGNTKARVASPEAAAAVAMSAGERIYRVRKTVMQMLRDRGYMVDQADVDQSEEDFFDKFSSSPQRDMLTLLVQKRDDPTDSIFVFWPADPKVGVKPIKRYMERMTEESVKRAILVVQQNLTAFARQALAEIQQVEGLTIEQFQESELLVNITEHVLVPQHMVLTKEVRGRAPSFLLCLSPPA
jgi:DNA-directed RNA polymerase I, II, and III subunit RPABC1